MKQYNVVELRKNLREALNDAESGEKIYIERHGVQFVLLATKNTPFEFSVLYPKEVSSDVRPNIQKIKKSSVATPQIESKIQEFQKEKKMKFCANGHAIPDGRSKCMGKGCKYA